MRQPIACPDARPSSRDSGSSALTRSNAGGMMSVQAHDVPPNEEVRGQPVPPALRVMAGARPRLRTIGRAPLPLAELGAQARRLTIPIGGPSASGSERRQAAQPLGFLAPIEDIKRCGGVAFAAVAQASGDRRRIFRFDNHRSTERAPGPAAIVRRPPTIHTTANDPTPCYGPKVMSSGCDRISRLFCPCWAIRASSSCAAVSARTSTSCR
jgi:hypothetical protein